MPNTANETFGDLLRWWRTSNGLSQLGLAGRAGVSQRHISFLESGRSKPSREMVIHLARDLEVPPREQNIMLVRAGFAPAHAETPLADLREVSEAIDAMLEGHSPNPAFVVDRQWNLVRHNAAAALLTGSIFTEAPAWIKPPLNLMRLSFHPDGMRHAMRDWDITAAALLRRLERDAAAQPHDTDLQSLLDEVVGYPDVEALRSDRRESLPTDLLVPATYVLREVPITFFTTIARIGDAHDLTLSELRLETFWPLDPESRSRWLAIAG